MSDQGQKQGVGQYELIEIQSLALQSYLHNILPPNSRKVAAQ
jgi:hypothetical protein